VLCYIKVLQSLPAKMARTIPYLQKRSDTYGFRIAVPLALQKYLHCRELTKSLATSDKALATVRALALGSRVKRIFHDLTQMTKQSGPLKDGTKVNFVLKIDLNEDGDPASITLDAEPHELEAANEAIRNAVNVLRAPTAIRKHRNVEPVTTSEIRMADVVRDFLERYPAEQDAMLKKHRSCLPALLEVVGNKNVSDLKRGDITEFFDLLEKLPPRWSDLKRQKGLSIREIAQLAHDVCISEKTFDYTYKASITPFLKWAAENYGDRGFPNLQISTVKYRGTQKAGLNKQRAFKSAELKRLFEGEEMRQLAGDPQNIHCYWLPLVGLYTGARVNEICQINPQQDVLKDVKTGIWYLAITEDTEGEETIKKRVKTASSKRNVPIHSRLIELGFLQYCEAVKAAGHKLLFASWKPSKGKASAEAEKWFRAFLKEIGLRDETPRAKLLGMHAFRHTFSNAAKNAGVDESDLVGHVGAATKVAAGYQGELWLENKQAILEKIQFDLQPPMPRELTLRHV
jgi:integrase